MSEEPIYVGVLSPDAWRDAPMSVELFVAEIEAWGDRVIQVDDHSVLVEKPSGARSRSAPWGGWR